MRNLGDAVSTVQALLGDPQGAWVVREYVLPLLNVTYASIYLNLKNASSKDLEAVVPVTDVPAGTTSLYPWQSKTAIPGAPPGADNPPALLAGLTDPIEVWVKPAGMPAQYYSRAQEIDTLPHVDPANYAASTLGARMYFTYLGGKLLITPVNQAIDVEVTGKFNPPPLVDDADLLVVHEDVWVPTTFKTAAIAGVERSNPQVLAGYQAEAIASQDNILAEMIRQGQGTPARFQRMSRSAGLAQWFWS